jgi:phosphatidylethanolamine/phosphatidyl-N-methylethanolamine N-methyltransferase
LLIPSGPVSVSPASPAARCGSNDSTALLREFARQPGRTGAIAPSSATLAAAIAMTIPHSGDPLIIELGPGTGAFTEAIQRSLGGRGSHIAVELNPRLAASLAERHPAVDVVQSSAEDLPRILAERGISTVDLVISGLPWVSLPPAIAYAALDAATGALAPSGAFTTFGYTFARRLPSARRFRGMLAARYEEVVAGRTIMRNLPPAFVYYARRPRGSLRV